MIRILLPKHTYNEARVKLVERVHTAFQYRTLSNVRRAYVYLEQPQGTFLEGFLENESKLPRLMEMLTDNPIRVNQHDEDFPDMLTVLIEDADDLEGVPY